MTSPPRSGWLYNRRSTLRTSLARGSTCHVVLPPDFRCCAALVHDVSRWGVGLVIAEPLPLGAALAIRPAGPAEPGRLLGVRVRHVTPLGDGRWLVGCAHATDLTADEVRVLAEALKASMITG
jgi:hypothetical protein